MVAHSVSERTRVGHRNSPGECWNASVQRNEVVFEIEVCEIVAVKELSGQLLQAAAGQVHRVHPLRGDLTKRERDGQSNAMSKL